MSHLPSSLVSGPEAGEVDLSYHFPISQMKNARGYFLKNTYGMWPPICKTRQLQEWRWDEADPWPLDTLQSLKVASQKESFNPLNPRSLFPDIRGQYLALRLACVFLMPQWILAQPFVFLTLYNFGKVGHMRASGGWTQLRRCDNCCSRRCLITATDEGTQFLSCFYSSHSGIKQQQKKQSEKGALDRSWELFFPSVAKKDWLK